MAEYELWKNDNHQEMYQLEGKNWKRTSNRPSIKAMIVSGYLTRDMSKEDISESIGLPWCPNNPNRLTGAYFYDGNVHAGRIEGSRYNNKY